MSDVVAILVQVGMWGAVFAFTVEAMLRQTRRRRRHEVPRKARSQGNVSV